MYILLALVAFVGSAFIWLVELLANLLLALAAHFKFGINAVLCVWFMCDKLLSLLWLKKTVVTCGKRKTSVGDLGQHCLDEVILPHNECTALT